MKISLVIPARIGSKRIKKKNIKEIHGKPLIYWAFRAAHIVSKQLDCSHVYLTSESDEIIAYTRNIDEFDINVIKRPDCLSTDKASIIDVLRHFNSKVSSDLIVLLYPTYPLRTPELIKDVIDYQLIIGEHSVITVVPVKDNPCWYVTKNNSDRLTKLIPNDNYRSQDVPPVYKMAGAVHTFYPDELGVIDNNGMNSNIRGFIVDNPLLCLEVDDEERWAIAEDILFKIHYVET